MLNFYSWQSDHNDVKKHPLLISADVTFDTYSHTFPFSSICHSLSKVLIKKKPGLSYWHSVFLCVTGSLGRNYIHFARINKDELLREVLTHTELQHDTITVCLTITFHTILFIHWSQSTYLLHPIIIPTSISTNVVVEKYAQNLQQPHTTHNAQWIFTK